MTGYGRCSRTFADKVITADIRALNSKYLDLNLRLPAMLKTQEIELRKIITDRIIRGKVEISINMEYLQGEALVKINRPLILSYIAELTSIARQTGLPDDQIMNAVMRLPGVTQNTEEVDEEDWKQVREVLEEAMAHFDVFRQKEGKAIDDVLRIYAQNIDTSLAETEKLLPQRQENMRQKIVQGLADFQAKAEIDANRFEQELIYYLERLDISEEVIRLRCHLKQYDQEMNNDSFQKGKKLGFLCQEIGREINTIGSKANFAPMQTFVIAMKDDLEKIKEQLNNIL